MTQEAFILFNIFFTVHLWNQYVELLPEEFLIVFSLMSHSGIVIQNHVTEVFVWYRPNSQQLC